MSVSPSLRQPIRQITALTAPGSTLVDDSLVLTRSAYAVHVTNVQKEDDRVSFGSSVVKTFSGGVAHVTWSPHLHGELATVLETGEVMIYDVESAKSRRDNLRQILEFSVDRPESPSCKSSAKAPRFPDAIRSQVKRLRQSWWRCEFGWHSKLLMVANAAEISLFDQRASYQHRENPTVIAAAHDTRKFCHYATDDRFVALARSEYNADHFAAATEQHLQLFDVRRPKSPVLQWEHYMADDPPGHLSFLPLKIPRGSEEAAGNMIMAASFRSGNIRCFCYGPQAPSALIVPGPSTRFQDIEDSYCAWQRSSKLFTAHLRDDSWSEVLRNSTNVLTSQKRNYDKLDLDCTESLSGLAVLPTTQNALTGFGLLQLSGSGGIFLQHFRSSASAKETPIRTGEVVFKLIKKRAPITCPMVSLKTYVMDEVGQKKKKKRKMKQEDAGKLREAIAGALRQSLEDADVFVSTYELAAGALLRILPEDWQKEAAGMPSNLRGLFERSSRPPYCLPPLKVLRIRDPQAPIPLPVVLEKHLQSQAATGGPFNYFEAACEAAREVMLGLRVKQEEDVVSLGEEDKLEQKKFCFRSISADAYFQSFIGAQASDEDIDSGYGGSILKLRLKPMDYDMGQEEVNIMASLQEDCEQWDRDTFPPEEG